MSDLRIEADLSGFDDVLADEPARVQSWLDGFTEDMVTAIKLSFGMSPAGEAYVRGGVVHIASIEGFPPNVDTGNLMGSITWETTDTVENTIYVGAEYGEYLEDGTEHIAPRPFMLPAFNEAGLRFESDAALFLDLEV